MKEKYEIVYDYTSEEDSVAENCVEIFEGNWLELQDYIKKMKEQGCYNIDANLICED